MKYLLQLSTICLISSITLTSHAYSPKLLLLEDNAGISQTYLDQNSKKKVAKDTVQVMVYFKSTSPVTSYVSDPYRSSITTNIVKCKNKAVAVGGGVFYAGRTSNSKTVGRFDEMTVRGFDGDDLRESTHMYDHLYYESIQKSLINRKIYDFACK